MKIAPGTILMKQDTGIPPPVRVSREANISGWTKDLPQNDR
jgi:hypothetical protein